MIGKDGDLSIIIKFEDIEALKRYETISDSFISDLKKSFVLKKISMLGFMFIITKKTLHLTR